ncbi:Protein odr-4-like protein [Sciurus carolinensis]|uniref:Protein odr-4 homolog n=1 Tax=Sciurus carolinensis TaxID=30640 RepID=A0AA41MGR6_SCICA|nr:Protein odr-4-like protein [Sciurus carolinensis]
MGRTYIVEETVGQYLSNISLQGKAFVSGLLIGQCSSQKDYVILATRTPPKEEQDENLKHPKAKLDNLDEEWATEHANQVSRMLPGGLLVLGVFIITTLELANDFQNALRRLIFAMEKSMNRKRLWNFKEDEVSERVILHICSSTKKISCRTYDVHDPKSSARPADWKYQSGLSTSWLSLECTIHIDIHIPLSSTSVNYTLEKNTKNGLIRWAKQIENGVYSINGQVKDEDCDLLEGQLLNSDHRSTATVQICSGSVNLKGSVKCRAYIHSNKPKVKDAVQVQKGITDSEKEFYILPYRVFVPVPGSTVKLCDYKFGDESPEEIKDHFIEMLDHVIQIEDLEIAEEINTGRTLDSKGDSGVELEDHQENDTANMSLYKLDNVVELGKSGNFQRILFDALPF